MQMRGLSSSVSYRVAIKGYRMPGSRIILTALHLKVVDKRHWDIFAINVSRLRLHVCICEIAEPLGASMTPCVQRAWVGSSLSILCTWPEPSL